MNAERVFLDTNILVYSLDDHYPDKQVVARNLINALVSERKAVVSTQVLQEFYNVLTKKMKCSPQNTKLCMAALSKAVCVHCNSVPDILNAVDISSQTQFSFWDSLVLSAAQAENCRILCSEDLNAGQVVCGITIVNPFA